MAGAAISKQAQITGYRIFIKSFPVDRRGANPCESRLLFHRAPPLQRELLMMWVGSASPHGEKLSLADFKGQVLGLNLWAKWCGPCKKELPLLEGYYRVRRQVDAVSAPAARKRVDHSDGEALQGRLRQDKGAARRIHSLDEVLTPLLAEQPR